MPIIFLPRGTSNAPAYPGRPISVGSQGDSVLRIQQCLNKISVNYPAIPKLAEDGIYGYGTRNAVTVFQRLFGLSQAGAVGPATWDKIMRACPANGGITQPGYPGYLLRSGSAGDAVLQVQRYINEISDKYPYMSIPKLAEDGIYGNGTRNAVMAFQRLFGLTADGADVIIRVA